MRADVRLDRLACSVWAYGEVAYRTATWLPESVPAMSSDEWLRHSDLITLACLCADTALGGLPCSWALATVTPSYVAYWSVREHPTTCQYYELQPLNALTGAWLTDYERLCICRGPVPISESKRRIVAGSLPSRPLARPQWDSYDDILALQAWMTTAASQWPATMYIDRIAALVDKSRALVKKHNLFADN